MKSYIKRINEFLKSYRCKKIRGEDKYVYWKFVNHNVETITIMKKNHILWVREDFHFVPAPLTTRYNLRKEYSLLRAYLLGRLRGYETT